MSGQEDLFAERPTPPPKRNLRAAKAARDEALTRVSKNSGTWFKDAVAAVGELRGYGEISGEDIRFMLTERGLPEPHHRNVWGSVIRVALKRGFLIPLDRRKPMSGDKSHARKTDVYRTP